MALVTHSEEKFPSFTETSVASLPFQESTQMFSSADPANP